MEALVPVAVALVLAVIAWKVLKGLVKIAVIVCIAALAGYFYLQGAI